MHFRRDLTTGNQFFICLSHRKANIKYPGSFRLLLLGLVHSEHIVTVSVNCVVVLACNCLVDLHTQKRFIQPSKGHNGRRTRLPIPLSPLYENAGGL